MKAGKGQQDTADDAGKDNQPLQPVDQRKPPLDVEQMVQEEEKGRQ